MSAVLVCSRFARATDAQHDDPNERMAVERAVNAAVARGIQASAYWPDCLRTELSWKQRKSGWTYWVRVRLPEARSFQR